MGIREVIKIGENANHELFHFEHLRRGDKFKMYEPDGKPVVYKGQYVFIAASDAYKNAQGVGCIEIVTETRVIKGVS